VTGLEWGHLIGGDAPQQNSSGTRSPNKRDFSPTMDSMYVYIYGKSTFCPECTPSIRRPSVSRRVLMVVYQMYTYLSTEVSCLSNHMYSFSHSREYKCIVQFTCTIANTWACPTSSSGSTGPRPHISHFPFTCQTSRPPSPRFRTHYRNKVILCCTVVYFPPSLRTCHAMLIAKLPPSINLINTPQRAVNQSHQSAIQISHTCAATHENDPPRPVDRPAHPHASPPLP
jgi:hypothetical protein